MKICLGIGSAAFKQMSASFLGRWDRVHLRSSNIIGCTLEERLALILLDLSENFGVPNHRGGSAIDRAGAARRLGGDGWRLTVASN